MNLFLLTSSSSSFLLAGMHEAMRGGQLNVANRANATNVQNSNLNH